MAARSHVLVVPFVALAAGLAAVPVASADPPAASPAPDAAGFKGTVQPFLTAHCVRCHNAKKAEGKLDLTALGADLAAGKGADAWQAVADRVSAGEMPPEGEKQPDPAAIKAVTGWVERELARAGKTGAVASGSLRTGNHVPHHLLFGPAAGAAPLDNPPRLWRVSPFIYAEAAKAFKGLTLAQPFALPPGDGFKDQAAVGGLDESTTAQLMRNAETIADEQLALRKVANKKPVKELAPLLDPAPTRPQIDAAVQYQFQLVLKRAAAADELKRFAELYASAAKLGGPEGGARAVLVAVLMQPEASFRSELGLGAATGGKRVLAPREIAFAIAYALTDRAPDAELLKAADTGRLATPADVSREVARIFADPKADKPRVLRFFREYFGYGGATEVFKDTKGFPAHNARGLVEDTDRLVRDIVAADKDVFVELFTTNKSYVHHTTTERDRKQVAEALAKYEDDKKKDPARAAAKGPPNLESKRSYLAYGLSDFPASQPVELPKDQRAGVLTQPAWLVANSENFDNHAIRRGKWVRERLLGGTVPDIPITVDAQLPDAPHKTLRERMEVTKQAYCWGCHKRMNPLGLAFEQFDHFGRFRTQDQVTVETTDAKGKKTTAPKLVPLDTSGLVDGTGDPAVDGPAPGAVEMIRRLAKTDRARQVFVRHAFRFWMGRDENPGDARTLMAADQAYLKSGGSVKALVTSLLTSESFLYRTAK
jgi:mono/diheme cytochrome c family protein